MNRKQYTVDKGDIRTVTADQTAYSEDKHIGFWMFVLVVLVVAAWSLTVILPAL